MKTTKIDFVMGYYFLESVYKLYKRYGVKDKRFIEELMKEEMVLSKVIDGRNEVKMVNIKFSEDITLKDCRVLASRLLNVEDKLPYLVRRVVTYFICEFSRMEVSDD